MTASFAGAYTPIVSAPPSRDTAATFPPEEGNGDNGFVITKDGLIKKGRLKSRFTVLADFTSYASIGETLAVTVARSHPGFSDGCQGFFRIRPKEMKIFGRGHLNEILDLWSDLWPQALEVWSRFIKLGSPRWCLNPKEAKKEQLDSSFAMIRLKDHAVVIDLSQIKAKGLEKFGREILAHEIGHHVYAPADLRDNARLLVRVKAGLPTREHLAGMIANLYTDLLINDRLQRGAGLDMVGVYKKLKVKNPDRLWTLYMRIYEELWGLPPGTLATSDIDRQVRYDASLGAKVIRAYAKDWLDGGWPFRGPVPGLFAEGSLHRRVALWRLAGYRTGRGGRGSSGRPGRNRG